LADTEVECDPGPLVPATVIV
jgi:hypothetical protein